MLLQRFDNIRVPYTGRLKATPLYRSNNVVPSLGLRKRSWVTDKKTALIGNRHLKLSCRGLASNHFPKFKELEIQSSRIDYKVREKVIDTIEELGLQVTASDVALKTGLPINQVSKALEALAYDSLASIQVSPRGYLVFRYDPGLRRRLLERSIVQRTQSFLRKNAPHIALASRVAFGACLLGTLCLVALSAAVLALSVAGGGGGSSEEEDDGRGNRRQRQSRRSSGYGSGFGYGGTFGTRRYSTFDTSWFLVDMADLLLCFHPSRRRWYGPYRFYPYPDWYGPGWFGGGPFAGDGGEGRWRGGAGARDDRQRRGAEERVQGGSSSSSSSSSSFYSGSAAENNGSGSDGTSESRMSLVASIFSFVFGDGNPNEDFEEERWQAVAQLIRSRNGVLTAEELAPLLSAPPPVSAATGDDHQTSLRSRAGVANDDRDACTYPDERFVIPALLRFDGRTVVDDRGHLLYTFDSVPALDDAAYRRRSSDDDRKRRGASSAQQHSGARGGAATHHRIHQDFTRSSGRRWPDDASRPSASPSFFSTSSPMASAASWGIPMESPLVFSKAPPVQCALAAFLGVLNLWGVQWLAGALRRPYAAMMLAEAGLGFVPPLVPFMRAYATFFVAAPIVRAAWIYFRNMEIVRRNAAREAALEVLRRGGDAAGNRVLMEKWESAKKLVAQRAAEEERRSAAVATGGGGDGSSTRSGPWSTPSSSSRTARGVVAGEYRTSSAAPDNSEEENDWDQRFRNRTAQRRPSVYTN